MKKFFRHIKPWFKIFLIAFFAGLIYLFYLVVTTPSLFMFLAIGAYSMILPLVQKIIPAEELVEQVLIIFMQ